MRHLDSSINHKCKEICAGGDLRQSALVKNNQASTRARTNGHVLYRSSLDDLSY